MGGQPGKPKPPGNPPIRPEPQEPKPIEEPLRPIPVPPVERPPAPIGADRVLKFPANREINREFYLDWVSERGNGPR